MAALGGIGVPFFGARPSGYDPKTLSWRNKARECTKSGSGTSLLPGR